MSKEGECCVKSMVYNYLNSKDEHLIRILSWIEELECLMEDIESHDIELAEELDRLIARLHKEAGIRISGIFSE